jgi:hypothetical protein
MLGHHALIFSFSYLGSEIQQSTFDGCFTTAATMVVFVVDWEERSCFSIRVNMGDCAAFADLLSIFYT